MQSPPIFDTKLYFSGSVQPAVTDHLLQNNVHRLFTYAYPKEIHEYMHRAAELGITGCRIMMDSGAFTAWNIGKPVQLADLMRYNDEVVTRYGGQHEFVFIALDVIPGERSRPATAEDVANAKHESYENYLKMRDHYGYDKVLPVYHSQDQEPSLRDAYRALAPYVCLSMDQRMPEKSRLEWAMRNAIGDNKYHGLAATGNNMVSLIDWFSVDSSSWVTVAAMGNILWPAEGRFIVLPISSTSPQRHERGKHLATLNPVEQEAALKLIASLGYSAEEMWTSHIERWKWNVEMWCRPPWKKKPVKPIDLWGEDTA